MLVITRLKDRERQRLIMVALSIFNNRKESYSDILSVQILKDKIGKLFSRSGSGFQSLLWLGKTSRYQYL